MTKATAGLSAHNPLKIKDLPRRCRAVVVRHDTDPATAERLAAVGLGVGASVTVLQSGDRPTVQVGESRIGLGSDLADSVHAIPLPGLWDDKR